MNDVHEGPFWDRVAGKLPPPPGSALLGWQPIEAGDGLFKASFQADERFLNPVDLYPRRFFWQRCWTMS